MKRKEISKQNEAVIRLAKQKNQMELGELGEKKQETVGRGNSARI